ncbi:hypothetical protein GCM10019016_080190 [Streptomyces prasinosporus]|uniref:Uncharacterized protein n=2 Tax=Streptomyces TaxID=1883 RepID=A0ABP6U0E7_9ACTN|nr:hypothetical protein [Streptomyces tricolor]MCG0062153.1 hypothetical protein [Streptomyces tricolor]GHC14225.1 hypothetical protein GCM10010332_50400 [Streptomyces albogriseolus]
MTFGQDELPGEFADLEGGEVGVGLIDGFGVCLALGVIARQMPAMEGF